MAGRIMIMAGGTGGHVFPALAVASELQHRGWSVFWLGTRNSFESRVIPQHGIDIEWIDIKGVRGKNIMQKILLPLRLLHAMIQAMNVIRKQQPDIVLGMGGFVSGPGGLIARLMNKPLVIQEQNTIAGMTNRWLAKIASRVFEAFPGTFDKQISAELSGNPVRQALFEIADANEAIVSGRPVRLLVLGGSLGAQALNQMIPQAIALLPEEMRPEIKHQAGRNKNLDTLSAYRQAEVDAEVLEFIDDMAAAYQWADLVICRSGALTVSELTAVGLASVLVPYPYAVDDHQTHNGQFLVDAGAAIMLQQSTLNASVLTEVISSLIDDRGRLQSMSQAAKSLAQPQAVNIIADACEELLS